MNIFVTGACGYKGSVLVPKLLAQGHKVLGIDLMWFGNHLDEHENLTLIKGDIRDPQSYSLDGIDIVIHLASIANDPCGDLDPLSTWETSCLATERLADKAARANVKQFIYASSASVYGLKDDDQITEDLPLVPISVYNQSKMVTERVVLSYQNQMIVQIIRPATVCGLSPRMRLDVVVNLLTMQALTRNKITVLGGSQLRPNIHIEDITDLYCFLIEHPEIKGIYNAGLENQSVQEIAELIQHHTGCSIEVKPSNDPRSYRLNSDKLASVGFKPKYTVEYAIKQLITAYEAGQLDDSEQWYNVSWMRGLLKRQTSRL
ncbi:SDR family oxidoreductase [Pseudoalteromonas sp. OOF1S-7]|uniref:NAD-dependent epimerase/dehydratase family protein n=1 Tax=Pseudoalteromonas sp. OOF1S-7 TaxID=2917757 RepID=UPI001EF532D3|nr:SDR family oxidoreductase [Pseudoalteromonas sp. OOF1S-7]MCG7537123.1 SDR family oxidoreductase [Pseudoalteromonas sp. OOF1S-7]